MDLPQFSNHDHDVNAIRERHRQAVTGFPAGPFVTVITRLFTWLLLTFLALLAMVSAFPWDMPAGEIAQVEHTGHDRALVIVIPVLLLLSVIPLVGSGSPKALKAFGVVWAVPVGSLVISAVISLF